MMSRLPYYRYYQISWTAVVVAAVADAAVIVIVCLVDIVLCIGVAWVSIEMEQREEKKRTEKIS